MNKQAELIERAQRYTYTCSSLPLNPIHSKLVNDLIAEIQRLDGVVKRISRGHGTCQGSDWAGSEEFNASEGEWLKAYARDNRYPK